MRPASDDRSSSSSNKFCRSEDLSNEASVESFFVNRLLADLGYKDSEIRPKTSIDALRVGKGRKKDLYKPDYVIVCRQKPRWLIDAKAPGENPDRFVDQGGGYCYALNQKHEDNPARYFMLTNGFLTRIYPWDNADPVLSLRFADFTDGNTKYNSLKELLGATAARSGWAPSTRSNSAVHAMLRPSMEEVKRTFYRCHRIIWKAEKVSPQAAFLRFAKILFVKLWEDRLIRDNSEYLAAIGRGDPLPATAVRFSTRWIEQQESHIEHPVDKILFRQLIDSLEAEIQARKRKRIFESTARLDVSPGTARRVVSELEHQYLFGIDEDLNGRMFEAFLVATMRGQALGQYFTPRSVVKLMTRLGKPSAIPYGIERVLDGCCGTGGFLIEALTEMRRQIYENRSLTNGRRKELLNEVANDAIFGIDAGQDPPLVKIARINMYLHGDGGSRLYLTDALRKTPTPSETDDPEGRQEVLELRRALGDGETEPLRFDLVLTNPPFSMDYSKNAPEEWAVLKGYELRTWGGKDRLALRSAVMFLERYHGLLKPGGRLLTVIDDSVLSGARTAFIRDYIRQRFIINGVVSLHGDAFRRSGARTKTSILYLTKRMNEEESQPDAFVFEARYIGLDDVPAKTRPSAAEEAKRRAGEEIAEIVAAYEDYLAGRSCPHIVPAARLAGRLDAKYLNPWSVAQLSKAWGRAGARTEKLGDLVDPIMEPVQLKAAGRYSFLRITYAGYPTAGDKVLGKEISYSLVGRGRPQDIVVSHINAVNGAVCVLTEKGAEHLITTEFTVLRIKPEMKNEVDPMYLWSILRSPAIIAEWLSSSTGLGRHRVDWELLKKQQVPILDRHSQKYIGDFNRKEHELHEQIIEIRERAIAGLNALDLHSDAAKDKLARVKPPR